MAYKHYEKDELLELLKPYFLLGMSIHKACATSGLCDDQTILNWCEDIEVRKKIESWQNYLSSKAREVWANKITDEKDYQASKEWLEKRDKDFANKAELDVNVTSKLNLSKLSDEDLTKYKELTDQATS